MSDLQFACPYCLAVQAVDEESAGKRVVCHACGDEIIVPGEAEPEPPEPYDPAWPYDAGYVQPVMRGYNYSLAGFVCGICSIVFSWMCCGLLVLPVCGVVFSSIGLVQSRRGHSTAPLVFASTGLSLSIFSIVGYTAFVAVILGWDYIRYFLEPFSSYGIW